MKKQIVIAAAILSIAPALALAFASTPAAQMPGVYISGKQIAPQNVEKDVNGYGASAVQFVPPPPAGNLPQIKVFALPKPALVAVIRATLGKYRTDNVPGRVTTECFSPTGYNVKYSFTFRHINKGESKNAKWNQNNARAFTHKLLLTCPASDLLVKIAPEFTYKLQRVQPVN